MEDFFDGLGKKIVVVIITAVVSLILRQAGCGSFSSNLGSGAIGTTVEHSLENTSSFESNRKKYNKTTRKNNATHKGTKESSHLKSIKNMKWVMSIQNDTNKELEFWLIDSRSRNSSTIVDLPGNKYKAKLYRLAPGRIKWIGNDSPFDMDFSLKSRGDFDGINQLSSLSKEFYDRKKPLYKIKKRILGSYYIDYELF